MNNWVPQSEMGLIAERDQLGQQHKGRNFELISIMMLEKGNWQ